MVGAGTLMIVLSLGTLFLMLRKHLEKMRWVLWLLPFTIALPYLANSTGWLMTKMGRQPWIVFGVMKTASAVSPGARCGIGRRLLGSVLPGFLWGVAITNIIEGVPIDANMQYVGGFWNLLNPYALLGGLAFVSLFMLHGAIFLSLRTQGALQAKVFKAEEMQHKTLTQHPR